jgi:hypothetical protein
MRVFVKDDMGGMIAEARNICVAEALRRDDEKTEVSHLFWLDDDVLCHPFALVGLYHHAYQRGWNIVSGVYFTRAEVSEPLLFATRFGGPMAFIPDRTFEVWGGSHGLQLVNTEVYKRMAAQPDFPRDRNGNPQWYKKPSPEDPEVHDGETYVGGTEDLFFMNVASRMGIKAMADTSRPCFGWHVDLETGQGFPKKQWEQRRKNEPITWDTPEGVLSWK